MAELIDQLRDVVWIRWRLRGEEKAVTLLGPASSLVAQARTDRADEGGGRLERAAWFFVKGGVERPNWSVRSDTADLLFRVQRTSRPTWLRGPCDGEYVVTAPSEIGRIGRPVGRERPITTADGQQLVWTVTDSHRGLATAAHLAVPGGETALELVPPRLGDGRVPEPLDGLVDPLDTAVVTTSTARAELLVLGFALALLELQASDEDGDRVSARYSGQRTRAPAGESERAARRAERARAENAEDDRHTRDLAERMRASGHEDLAEDLEARRDERRRRRGP